MDWKKHFNQQAALFEETEFLKQVQKTVSGQPITPAQFDALVSDIRNSLDIRSDDFIFDMCCANGVITAKIAKACRAVIGIDFSEPLINIAGKYNKPANVTYFCMSVLDQNVKKLTNNPFSKVYMNESLQHFKEDDLPEILELIIAVSSPTPVILISGIPDIDKLWDFYDTDERREEYKRRKSQNQEAIGTWWSRDYIADVCLQNGLKCEFLSQNPILHSAHYRFDVRLTKLVN